MRRETFQTVKGTLGNQQMKKFFVWKRIKKFRPQNENWKFVKDFVNLESEEEKKSKTIT